MKKLLLSIIFIISSGYMFSQSWAPVGSEWHYSEHFFGWNPISEDYIKIESVKDTLFNGQSCRKLVKRHNPMCNGRPNVEYMYSEGSKVYFWDFDLEKFQVIYDFDMVAGDSLVVELFDYEDENDTMIIYVDSSEAIFINGVIKNKQFVTYALMFDDGFPLPNYTIYYSGEIIESIGDNAWMFNYFPQYLLACDGNFSSGLRCYYDEELGLYETGIAPYCEHQEYVGVEVNNEPRIKLSPNPCQGVLYVETDINSDLHYRVIDVTGQQLSYGKVENNTINIGNKVKGFFIVELLDKAGKVVYNEKIISNN